MKRTTWMKPNERRQMNEPQSTTFVAIYIYKYTPECSMKNRELFITAKNERTRETETFEYNWKMRQILSRSWRGAMRTAHTVNFLCDFFLWVCVCVFEWASVCFITTRLIYYIPPTNSFMCSAHLLYSSAISFWSAHLVVSCLPAKSKWCGFVIVHVNRTTRFYWAPFWTHTHTDIFTIPAVFADFVKLNKCCAILRVKIEIVFSLSHLVCVLVNMIMSYGWVFALELWLCKKYMCSMWQTKIIPNVPNVTISIEKWQLFHHSTHTIHCLEYTE